MSLGDSQVALMSCADSLANRTSYFFVESTKGVLSEPWKSVGVLLNVPKVFLLVVFIPLLPFSAGQLVSHFASFTVHLSFSRPFHSMKRCTELKMQKSCNFVVSRCILILKKSAV